jgi:hypothetical protein
VKSLPVLMASLLAAFCLGSCLQTQSVSDPDADPDTEPEDTGPLPTSGVSHDYSYTVRENTLFITRDQVWRRCVGDSLLADTVRDRTDTIEFELEEDSWRQLKNRETLNSGAVVRWVRAFKRRGEGTGLEGVWIRPQDSYRVVSGSLDPEERTQQDAMMRNANLSLKYHDDRVTVTDDTYTEYLDIRHAAQFVDLWNGTIFPGLAAESALYDIELSIVDKYTVELRGRKNDETVKLSRRPNWDLSITSSNPDHAPLHYHGEPESCPNPQEPAWYRAFLDANRKSR